MKSIPIALLTLIAACASDPTVTIDTEHGLVRASTRAEAQRVADALAFAPQVRATLHSTRSGLPIVWVVERDLGAAKGICYERRIELTPEGAAHPLHILHEVVHWYIPGSPFDGLPHFVEEGLADFVALQLLGLADARQREQDAIADVTVPKAALDSDAARWFTLPDETKVALTRLGFAVVSRLGLERLQTLAAAQEGPWSYLEEARLSPRY